MEVIERCRANGQTPFREASEIRSDSCAILPPEFNCVDNGTDHRRRGSLKGAVEGKDRCCHDGYVEDTPKGCEANDDRRNRAVELPQVSREGRTEERQRSLNNEGRELHNVVEIPLINPAQFAFAIPASVLDGPVGVCLPVLVEPLLPECCQESCEQRGRKGCIKYGLGLADGGSSTGPAWWRDDLAGGDVAYGDIEDEL